nr:sce7726 family protein [uncultured Sphingomonas sp.]
MRDIDVRSAVRAQLYCEHAGDQDTQIVEEMGIWSGSARIDIAVINGELAGWELKSARDNLQRLPAQAQLYSEVFDRVTIVAATNHLLHCIEMLPEWWGVVEAQTQATNVSLETVREAKPNPNHNPIQVARLLWRDECLAILDKHQLGKGCRSKPSWFLHERLTELPLKILRDEVRDSLKARPNWLGKLALNQA